MLFEFHSFLNFAYQSIVNLIILVAANASFTDKCSIDNQAIETTN